MWKTEYELQRPDEHQLLILPETLAKTFDKSLGDVPGEIGVYYEFAAPRPGALYAHGADWAKEVDFTDVVTLRVDCHPMMVVAYERTQRQAWPLMIGLLNERMKRYGGPASHDATGIGGVISDYLTGDPNQVEGITMGGHARQTLFNDYLVALDAGAIVSPHIACVYEEHRRVTRRDLYGSGHPPDSLVALSMSLAASRRSRFDLGITI